MLIWIGLGLLGLAVHHSTKAGAKPFYNKKLTPARAHIHGQLMGYEINPHKLMRAADLFSREGLQTEAHQLSDKARTIGHQMKAAAELAERARAGDQNAMAMIAACREQAKQGNKRAFVTCVCIEQYCKMNPPKAADGPEAHAEVS